MPLRFYLWALIVINTSTSKPCVAQDRAYVGAVAGSAILSGDGRSVFTPSSGAVSGYDPETGAALNVFAGMHLIDYVSIQGNYIWNRNNLTLAGARFGEQPASFHEAVAVEPSE
jgi:hypothetical protein